MHIDLPDGQSAELRDVAKLSERDRGPAKRCMVQLTELRNAQVPVAVTTPQPVLSADGTPQAPAAPEVRLTVEMYDVTDEATKLLAVGLIESWTYAEPVSYDGLLNLPGDAYDVLFQHAQQSLTKVFPDYSAAGEGSPTTA